MSKNFDFVPNFQKMSILVEFSKKFRFWSKFSINSCFFRKFSILVKFWQKFQFWSNVPKLWAWSNLQKKFDFGLIFEKFRFCSKFSNNFDLSQIFEEISILVKFSKKKILFFGKFSKITKNSGFTKLFEKFKF